MLSRQTVRVRRGKAVHIGVIVAPQSITPVGNVKHLQVRACH